MTAAFPSEIPSITASWYFPFFAQIAWHRSPTFQSFAGAFTATPGSPGGGRREGRRRGGDAEGRVPAVEEEAAALASEGVGVTISWVMAMISTRSAFNFFSSSFSSSPCNAASTC